MNSFELTQQQQSLCRLGGVIKDTMLVDVGLGKTSTVLRDANFLNIERKMFAKFHQDEQRRLDRLRKLGVRRITKFDDSTLIEFSCLRVPRKLKKRLKKMEIDYVEETKRLAASIDLACHISLMDCGLVTGRNLVIGEDLHQAKAASITGMRYSEITPEIRRFSKASAFYDMYSRQVHEVKPRTLKSLASEPRWAYVRDYVNKDMARQRMMNRTFEIIYGDCVLSESIGKDNGEWLVKP